MPRSCTVCAHSERGAIDEALFRNTASFRNVAKQYDTTASALFRHKRHSVRECAEPLENLSPRKRAYIQGRIEGKSKRQAALDAGFSESMANHATDKIETRDVREAFTRLVREMVPAEQIAKTIAEGMAATETKFFAHEGIVQDHREVPAWSERRQYAELAAAYGGYQTRDKEERSGGGVILLFGDPPKPELENRTVVEPPADGKAPILLLPDRPQPTPSRAAAAGDLRRTERTSGRQ